MCNLLCDTRSWDQLVTLPAIPVDGQQGRPTIAQSFLNNLIGAMTTSDKTALRQSLLEGLKRFESHSTSIATSHFLYQRSQRARRVGASASGNDPPEELRRTYSPCAGAVTIQGVSLFHPASPTSSTSAPYNWDPRHVVRIEHNTLASPSDEVCPLQSNDSPYPACRVISPSACQALTFERPSGATGSSLQLRATPRTCT